MKIQRVLISSAAAKIPLLKAVRDALQHHAGEDADVAVIAGDAAPDVISAYFADEFWQMPRLSELAGEALLADLRARDIHAVIPTRDGELAFWAARREELAAAGIAVMVANPAAVEACTDKVRFAERLEDINLPAIPTELKVCEGEYPRVVKERFGAGSRGIGLNLSRAQAAEFAERMDQPIFQPFIEGEEFSIDAYFTRQGKCHGAIARRRMLVIGGESKITETVDDPHLLDLCRDTGEYLGLDGGHAVFQVIYTPQGHAYVVECNARFGGASSLSLAAGLPSFRWFLEEAETGAPITPFTPAPVPLRQVRYSEDLLIAP